MQTRGAARRAAQAAAASAESIPVDVETSLGDSASSGISLPGDFATPHISPSSPEPIASPNIPISKRKYNETITEPTVPEAPAKRTRRTKKTAQPIKGGWVLPHGMGLVTQSPSAMENSTAAPTIVENTSVDAESKTLTPDHNSSQQFQADERPAVFDSGVSLTPSASPSEITQSLAKTAPKRGATQKAAPRKTATRRAGPRTATNQARIGFRVSKSNTVTKADTQVEISNQLETVVKEEEVPETVPTITEAVTAVNDSENVAEALHVTHQTEVAGRVTRSRAAPSTQVPVKHEQQTPDQTLIVAKKEVVVEEKAGTAVITRKLIIFRGITVNDNLVTKSFGKILVDASQILNPDYRIQVKRGKDNPYGLTPGYSPYPYRRVPTPEACEEVHRILTEMHGEVKQPDRIPAASLEKAGCGEVPYVLDALLRTLISGNTLMAMADAAIKKLGEDFGLSTEGAGAGSINWEKVRVSSHQALVNSIKISGNGPKKAQHIKMILDKVYEENLERLKKAGKSKKNEDGTAHDLLSLDYMHAMTKDQAMDKFVSFPGIGIKTAACVSLFCLRMPCFAVDTHVHKFCRWLGWTPVKADPDNVFRHGDFMVPDHLKYGLHQLFIRHGQTCFKCRKMTKPGSKDWNEAPDCPLEHLLDRSKDDAKPPGPKKPRKAAKKVKDDEDSDDADVVEGVEPEDEGTGEEEKLQGNEEKIKSDMDEENEEGEEDEKGDEDNDDTDDDGDQEAHEEDVDMEDGDEENDGEDVDMEDVNEE
ncbi:hypothetical protein QBC41DRAFT_356467 [Cercophora samala]|uniref:HhH-GPD domain-containing protein n=1 Tax=Cercophora samala TaxID=330535 RepID=A0AA39ZDN5_9PEZI|nr:hypothetical protein QBC41DRAFT_356467 [Cercophora samala]